MRSARLAAFALISLLTLPVEARAMTEGSANVPVDDLQPRQVPKDVTSAKPMAGEYKINWSATEHERERRMFIKFNPDVKEMVDKNIIKPEDILVDTVDLNGDGLTEFFIYIEDSYSCGSVGCTFHVYGEVFPNLNDMSGDGLIIPKDVTVLPGLRNGYHDLAVVNPMGERVIWTYNGEEYEPRKGSEAPQFPDNIPPEKMPPMPIKRSE